MMKSRMLILVMAVLALVAVSEAGTIAYWQMDEGTANGQQIATLTDSAGTRNLDQQLGWTEYRNVSLPVAPNGQAVAGNEEYMYTYGAQGMFAIDPGFLDDTSFTAEIFYRRDDADRAGTLFGNGHSSAYEGIAAVKVLANGSIELSLVGDDVGVGGNSIDVITASAPDDTGWHHLAFTYDGTNVKTYVDYNIADTTAPTYYNGRVFTGYTYMQVGWSNAGAPDYYHLGDLDELRFSDTVLAPSEFLGAVPEPATIALMTIGGAFLARRRKR